MSVAEIPDAIGDPRSARWGGRGHAADPRPGHDRPRATGKFLSVGAHRLWVRGVTYGTFAPDQEGHRFPAPDQVRCDFEAMVDHGFNAVRVYTVPPRWLLDAAADAGLWVLVGLAWEQHVAFLDDRRRTRRIVRRIRAEVAQIAEHPAILAFAVGNEIPAAIVRWHGRRRVQRFLDRLCRAVHRVDRDALVTYVNFPSSEYLSVTAADIVCFNVYLEQSDELAAYVSRLQTLADERPLLITELGLDSLRHGLEQQARQVTDQIETAFAGGSAGAFVFAWTDEWHRGGEQVTGWGFGLTDHERNPKPALGAVAIAFDRAIPTAPPDAPLVSVVVCTYNGEATLRECLEGVLALEYPRVEAILVDDGSTDGSVAIAHDLGVNVISTPNCGLSAARNTGLHASKGELVAYLDDDARPDPQWLTYLVQIFRTTDHAAVGGPNIPPEDERGIASCVANAPGGPVQVLLSDTVAEHIPGCNMAFRRESLLALGGFDARFHTAGDDVDICWRLQEQGMTLGFHPAAMVWHRRRGTVSRFWRQQRGYGEAEAALERKWPEKYNAPGHSMWSGRLYGRGTAWLGRRSHVYHGTWGTAAFQPELSLPAGSLRQLTAAPEWYLVIAGLAGLTLLGGLWDPLLLAFPLLLAATVATLANAVSGARGARFGPPARRWWRRLALQAVTLVLHLLQPAARLRGRLANGLVPWRRPERWKFALPLPRSSVHWSEAWCAPEERLRGIAGAAREHGTRVIMGGATDRWDLEIRGGALGAVRLWSVTEEHGAGKQLRRFRIRPSVPHLLAPLLMLLLAAGVGAELARSPVAGMVLVVLAGATALAAVCECGIATATAERALSAPPERARPMLELVKECTTR